ncbi:hypothetical protein BESB_050650 [Besnoitia besnoiti]|uniref:Uncharacterized protein n=1 Tax=Besnoitia besnoiti TaxID=94643 RepID=A0A2A9MM76_BESBE|nr:hypothetical protein BESB_050650 [Besnoitia besnoiti]PFH36873.1 hypothetical protein BESB_050650 [Besnoitia besnoiti]
MSERETRPFVSRRRAFVPRLDLSRVTSQTRALLAAEDAVNLGGAGSVAGLNSSTGTSSAYADEGESEQMSACTGRSERETPGDGEEIDSAEQVCQRLVEGDDCGRRAVQVLQQCERLQAAAGVATPDAARSQSISTCVDSPALQLPQPYLQLPVESVAAASTQGAENGLHPAPRLRRCAGERIQFHPGLGVTHGVTHGGAPPCNSTTVFVPETEQGVSERDKRPRVWSRPAFVPRLDLSRVTSQTRALLAAEDAMNLGGAGSVAGLNSSTGTSSAYADEGESEQMSACTGRSERETPGDGEEIDSAEQVCQRLVEGDDCGRRAVQVLQQCERLQAAAGVATPDAARSQSISTCVDSPALQLPQPYLQLPVESVAAASTQGAENGLHPAPRLRRCAGERIQFHPGLGVTHGVTHGGAPPCNSTTVFVPETEQGVSERDKRPRVWSRPAFVPRLDLSRVTSQTRALLAAEDAVNLGGAGSVAGLNSSTGTSSAYADEGESEQMSACTGRSERETPGDGEEIDSAEQVCQRLVEGDDCGRRAVQVLQQCERLQAAAGVATPDAARSQSISTCVDSPALQLPQPYLQLPVESVAAASTQGAENGLHPAPRLRRCAGERIQFHPGLGVTHGVTHGGAPPCNSTTVFVPETEQGVSERDKRPRVWSRPAFVPRLDLSRVTSQTRALLAAEDAVNLGGAGSVAGLNSSTGTSSAYADEGESEQMSACTGRSERETPGDGEEIDSAEQVCQRLVEGDDCGRRAVQVLQQCERLQAAAGVATPDAARSQSISTCVDSPALQLPQPYLQLPVESVAAASTQGAENGLHPVPRLRRCAGERIQFHPGLGVTHGVTHGGAPPCNSTTVFVPETEQGVSERDKRPRVWSRPAFVPRLDLSRVTSQTRALLAAEDAVNLGGAGSVSGLNSSNGAALHYDEEAGRECVCEIELMTKSVFSTVNAFAAHQSRMVVSGDAAVAHLQGTQQNSGVSWQAHTGSHGFNGGEKPNCVARGSINSALPSSTGLAREVMANSQGPVRYGEALGNVLQQRSSRLGAGPEDTRARPFDGAHSQLVLPAESPGVPFGLNRPSAVRSTAEEMGAGAGCDENLDSSDQGARIVARAEKMGISKVVSPRLKVARPEAENANCEESKRPANAQGDRILTTQPPSSVEAAEQIDGLADGVSNTQPVFQALSKPLGGAAGGAAGIGSPGVRDPEASRRFPDSVDEASLDGASPRKHEGPDCGVGVSEPTQGLLKRSNQTLAQELGPLNSRPGTSVLDSPEMQATLPEAHIQLEKPSGPISHGVHGQIQVCEALRQQPEPSDDRPSLRQGAWGRRGTGDGPASVLGLQERAVNGGVEHAARALFCSGFGSRQNGTRTSGMCTRRKYVDLSPSVKMPNASGEYGHQWDKSVYLCCPQVAAQPPLVPALFRTSDTTRAECATGLHETEGGHRDAISSPFVVGHATTACRLGATLVLPTVVAHTITTTHPHSSAPTHESGADLSASPPKTSSYIAMPCGDHVRISHNTDKNPADVCPACVEVAPPSPQARERATWPQLPCWCGGTLPAEA